MAQEQKYCVSDTGRQILQVKSTSTSKTSYTDFHTILGREEGGPQNRNSTKVDVCHWEVFQMDFPPAYAQLNTFLEHK